MKFFKEDEGASAVEYGVLIAAVVTVIVAVVFVIGVKIDNAFEALNIAL